MGRQDRGGQTHALLLIVLMQGDDGWRNGEGGVNVEACLWDGVSSVVCRLSIYFRREWTRRKTRAVADRECNALDRTKSTKSETCNN